MRSTLVVYRSERQTVRGEAVTTSSTARYCMRPGPCGKTCMYGIVLASLRGSLTLAQWDTGRQVFHSAQEIAFRYATNLPGRRYRWRHYCLTPDCHCCPRCDE